MTRLERFEWVLDTYAGAKNAVRPFARRIGLANERSISVLLGRLRKKPDTAGFDGETLAKIMKRTGVNPLWLMYGDEPRTIDASLGDPELSIFLADLTGRPMLKAAALETYATVSEIKAMLASDTGDKPVAEWKSAIGDLRSLGPLAKAAEDLDIDELPPPSEPMVRLPEAKRQQPEKKKTRSTRPPARRDS